MPITIVIAFVLIYARFHDIFSATLSLLSNCDDCFQSAPFD